MPICTIYKITNVINGKIYIGQTWRAIQKRFRAHVYCAKTKAKNYVKLENAILKYGPENFTIIAVHTTKIQSEADALEASTIAAMDSTKKGYNIRPGGNTSKLNKATIEKMSAARLGKHLSADHRLAQSLGQARHSVSIETRQKIAKSLRGRPFVGKQGKRVRAAGQGNVRRLPSGRWQFRARRPDDCGIESETFCSEAEADNARLVFLARIASEAAAPKEWLAETLTRHSISWAKLSTESGITISAIDRMSSGQRIISEKSKKVIESAVERILLIRNSPAVIAEEKRKSELIAFAAANRDTFRLSWTRSENPKLMLAFAGRIVSQRILVVALANVGKEVLKTLADGWVRAETTEALSVAKKLLSDTIEKWTQGEAAEVEMVMLEELAFGDRNGLSESAWSEFGHALKYMVSAMRTDFAGDTHGMASAVSLSVEKFVLATCEKLRGDKLLCRSVRRRISTTIRKSVNLTVADLVRVGQN